jgi:glycosyltransferase involved in cell wall biosynthesis
VFSFLVHANVVAAGAARVLNDVKFFQSIQTAQPEPAWHWQAQRYASSQALKIAVPSESVRVAAIERSDVTPEKLEVISNAIDPADFTEPLFTRWPAERQGVRVGFVGRLDPVKRIPVLIEAMTRLPMPFRLDLFGQGSERVALQQQIERLSLRDRVTLVGAVTRPQTALGQIDVLVLPSLAEGFGLVLIEAMAAGIPVVATDAPGIRTVVSNDVNGLLVPIDDPAALAQAIERVTSDRALQIRLVEAGRRTVAERYSWASVLPAYGRLLGLKIDQLMTAGSH